jgi:hypothetical protein
MKALNLIITERSRTASLSKSTEQEHVFYIKNLPNIATLLHYINLKNQT